ncbi:hypothetical protein KQ945_17520 [Bacillus subtilis subsp. subtilis]|nr:hypothetical protein [Bacillus subtilis subsp. subtilis]
MRRAVGTHGTVHGIDGLQQRHDAGQTLPTLYCDSAGCTAPLTFVPAQARAERSAPPPVPAYFKLAKGAAHAPGCRYDAPGYLDALLAAAPDPDFVHALDDGKHELRLLALHQALKRGGGPPLDNQLPLLAQLLVVRAMCGNDSLLAARLVLRLGKKKTAWDAFFYDQDRYDQAWARLDAATSEVPFALVGTVRSHRPGQSGSDSHTTFLNCAPQYLQTGIVDRREFVEVSVGHDDAAWLHTFAVGTEIIMFGLWRQGRSHTATRPHPTDPRRTITNVTHKLALRPVSMHQLAVV